MNTMIKNSIFALAAVALFFTSCNKEEDAIFSKSAAERITEAVATYTVNLAQAPGGWLMEYYPTRATDCQGVLMCAKLQTNGLAHIAMFNDYSIGQFVADSSCWEVIADQGPVLTFNTYNKALHYFSDPSIYDTGYGFEGDYEFVIIDMKLGASNAMLKGKKSGAYINLSRMPDTLKVEDYRAYLQNIRTFQSNIFPEKAKNYDLLHIGDNLYRIDDIASGCPNIYPFGKDAIANESYHNFLITKHFNDKYYLRFRDSLQRVNVTMQEFEFNDKDTCFVAVGNPNVKITGADPFTFFKERMINNNETYTTTGVASDSINKITAAITEQFKKEVKYTYQSFSISILNSKDQAKNDTTLVLSVNYKNNKGTTSSSKFYFSYKWTEKALVLKYTEPVDKASGNVLARITSIQNLLNTLSSSFTSTSADHKFNLNTMSLQSATDPRIWAFMKLKVEQNN